MIHRLSTLAKIAFFALLSLSPAHAEKRPNVLFLAVDDMNDWIGCFKTTPGAITPNPDHHRYHHGEKYDWGKHTLWERTSHVPFIWAGPGVAKGARTDVTVSLLDMYPTLVEMCGLPGPRQNLEGTLLKKSAPKEFAPPAPKRNVRKDLIIEGESFRWRTGDGKKPQPDAPAVKTAGKTAGKKNVLLIVCDDLNTHVTPSGYEHIFTPAMAQFASGAMTFKRAFCQYPVCGPSRASFLSGLYPESTGVLDNKLDIRETRPGTPSLPQFFKENGYWTGEVGKVFHSPRHNHGEVAWHESHFYRNDELPVVTAARKKFEAENGSVELPKNREAWRERSKEAASKLDAQTPPGYGRSGLRDEQHKDGKNARTVAKWLRDKPNGAKPFFIACGIQKPHVPFLAPSKYFDLYPLDEIVYTPDKPDLWKTLPRGALNGRFKEFGFELGVENDSLRREYMQAYHACVSFIDAQLKLVMDALKECGEWEDTIVILTSDHGYHLGDHFLWGKVSLFDIGAKVPFIIRVPGLTKPGTESQAMVELIDIYPTLAHLTGLEGPDHLQGASLRPLLDHPGRPGKKTFAYSVVKRGEKMGSALRSQKWRYAKWEDGEELYNLTNDPEEKVNLAGRKNLKVRLEEFRRVLEMRQKQASSRLVK